MQVTRIKNINHRILRNFTWSTHSIDDFSRYNLIYGWNFSGKTTLANLFQLVEDKTDLLEGSAVFTLNTGHDVKLNEISKSTILPQVRVFNKRFIEKHVGFTSDKLTSPIFVVIGDSAPELQSQLDKKKQTLHNFETTELTKREKERSDIERTFNNYGTEQARHIREFLGKPRNPYYNYERPQFFDSCERLTDAATLTKEQFDSYKEQSKAITKDEIAEIKPQLPDLSKCYHLVQEILQRDILSRPIVELVSDASLSEWIRRGLELHSQRNSETCLFCQNRISPIRLDALRTHFDQSFNMLMRDIDNAKGEIEIAKTSFKVVLPDDARFHDHLKDEYKLKKNGYESSIKLLQETLDALRQELENKKLKPFNRLRISTPPIEFDHTKLDDLNQVIKEHNLFSKNIVNDVKKALDSLHKHMITKAQPRYQELKTKLEKAKQTLSTLEKNRNLLEKEINEIEAGLKSHRPPVDELNRDLQSYLGHAELHLVAEDTGYRLTRSGQPATDLSEGEKTALAFLYFLRRLSDVSFNLNKGIVVIDDPVSSLDANSLYYAFGFIKAKTKDAVQLFIFTHNFQFFSLVRNWFNYEKKEYRRFYQIQCSVESNSRGAVICPLDKLLSEYDSEYHYLFKIIKKRAERTLAFDTLEGEYMYPNLARRLLESFFAFRFPSIRTDFHKKLERVSSFQIEKRIRIERFLQTGSHDSEIPEQSHDISILSETGPILQDVLELIETADKDHYEEMVGLCQ